MTRRSPGTTRAIFWNDERRWAEGALLVLGALLAITIGLATAAHAKGTSSLAPVRACSDTTEAQYRSCGYQALDDYYFAVAHCINLTDAEERDDCYDDARKAKGEANQACLDQRAERFDICDLLGEQRYDPSFEPADFESDYHDLEHTNPYFPLTIGYVWNYDGTLETNTIESLDKTKLVEGVTCIVLKDLRYDHGQLVEETDDWYGQRKNGTVDFCGEQVNNYETFPGDVPAEPERLSVDGQWKTGRDGDPPGTFLLGAPKVGDVHRQEFSPGSAEDIVIYLSTNYSYGSDPELDQYVPKALVDLFCGNHDCLVTRERTGIEPGESTRQYYARGVGFILGLDEATGDTVELVGCNFDSRCDSLRKH